MSARGKNNTISGCVLIVVGAWAALGPFLAGAWTWEWHLSRFLLALLPGGAAVLGGLIMLAGRRLPATFGGILALAGGLWLIAGPPVYALLVGPDLGTGPSGESVRMFQWIGFFFGAGALVSLVSSYALGFPAPLQFADEMWHEPARTRARIPLPPERPRRQRGIREPVGRGARPHTRAKGSPRDAD
jgi:hypothetical protein